MAKKVGHRLRDKDNQTTSENSRNLGPIFLTVPVVYVDDVCDGEDADESCPEVGSLAPQVFRLLLHVHRVPDVDLDLVLYWE